MTTRVWIRQAGAWIGVIAALGILGVLVLVVVWYPPDNVRLSSPIMLAVSFSAMVLGLIFQYVVWHFMVRYINPAASYSQTFRAHALAIWAKYIPGKVWSVLGRAGLLARISGMPLRDAVGASAAAQVIMLVTGGMVAAPVLIQMAMPTVSGGMKYLVQWSLFIVVCLGCVFLIRILKKNRATDRSATGQVALAGLSAVVVWAVWGASLAALVASLGKPADVVAAIGQYAAAVCAGIASIVVPGGLGVREGVVSFLLVMEGFHVGEAAGVGILLRMVSVFGELFVFAVGLMVPFSRMLVKRRGNSTLK